ncbi:methyltransferase domain-containing protein [Kamptonema cortianum]|jgi:ubiquinone/menaquinone biosynthesis C-methylase UbiE|nr:methyltransferase domain-containing protein [Kamptonema cortianum]
MNKTQIPLEAEPAVVKRALGFRWLTPLYDPLIHYFLREQAWKSALINQAHIAEAQKILDLGCGTGTLVLSIKRQFPTTDMYGLDGDTEILEIARQKANQQHLSVTFDHGLSDALPYPDATFDRVLCSLMLHHLTYEQKLKTAQEVYRSLKVNGEFHVADWGKPQNALMRFTFLSVQLLDGFETTTDNVQGKLPQIFEDAGFVEVEQTEVFATVLGTLALFKAKKPQ